MDLAIGLVRGRVTDQTRFALLVGRALSGLSLLFLAFDAAGKLLLLPPVVRAAAELGFAAGDVTPIGAVLLPGISVARSPPTCASARRS
jgi:hypothetical protein